MSALVSRQPRYTHADMAEVNPILVKFRWDVSDDDGKILPYMVKRALVYWLEALDPDPDKVGGAVIWARDLTADAIGMPSHIGEVRAWAFRTTGYYDHAVAVLTRLQAFYDQ